MHAIKKAVLLPVVCLLLSGCYTPTKDTRARFQESASADVVLQFYKWDSFFIIRPDYRDNGFLRPLNERILTNALDALNVRRDMAVVVIGWTYDPGQLAEIAKAWRTVLGKRGFKRVVCLSGESKNNLDGLPVIDDWKQPVDETKQNARL